MDLLDKREERIQRMFDEIAPKYDLLNHLLSLNIDTYWRRRTTELVPVQGDAPILDLCTGTGDLAFAYDRASKGTVPIIAADFSHEMLVRGVAKAKKRKLSDRITFVAADAQELPFASDHFQIACVAFGLRNVTNTDRGLSEMVRVTKPGGRVAILEFSRPRHWFFGRMYRYYFRFMLPLVGQVFSRSKDKAYRYLPESVMTFPDGDEMLAKLRAHGLMDVSMKSFTFGVATLYVGVKPERPA